MKLIGVSAETSPSFSARVHSMWPPVPSTPASDQPQPGDALRPLPDRTAPAAATSAPRAGWSRARCGRPCSVRESCLIWIATMRAEHRRRHRHQAADGEARRARPHDHQHADEADDHRRPAPHAHLLAQHSTAAMVTNSGVEYDSETACASGRWPIAQKPAQHRDDADHAADEVERQLGGAQQARAVPRSSSGSSGAGGRRSCGRTRSRSVQLVSEARRMHTAISPNADRAGQHQQRARAAGCRATACGTRAHQRRADDARLGLDAPRRTRPAPSRRCGAPAPAVARRWRAPWLTSTSACCARHAGIAVAMALPAALRRSATPPTACGVSSLPPRNTGSAGCASLQRLGLRGRHDRILEEAAGIADHAPGRAACAADADHRLGDVRRRGERVDAHRLQFLARCRRSPAAARAARGSANSTAVTM